MSWYKIQALDSMLVPDAGTTSCWSHMRVLCGFEHVLVKKEAEAGCISDVSVGSPDSRKSIIFFQCLS